MSLRLLNSRLASDAGQSTLEAALVLALLLGLSLALGFLWQSAKQGDLTALSLKGASHLLGGGDVRAIQDIVSF